MSAEDWRKPLREAHSEEGETWEDTTPEDEHDEWGEAGPAEVEFTDGDEERL